MRALTERECRSHRGRVACGAALRFSCAEHRDAWAGRIRGAYLVLERDEWEARGAGYRGAMLGS